MIPVKQSKWFVALSALCVAFATPGSIAWADVAAPGSGGASAWNRSAWEQEVWGSRGAQALRDTQGIRDVEDAGKQALNLEAPVDLTPQVRATVKHFQKSYRARAKLKSVATPH
jgi:hypothetical protein